MRGARAGRASRWRRLVKGQEGRDLSISSVRNRRAGVVRKEGDGTPVRAGSAAGRHGARGRRDSGERGVAERYGAQGRPEAGRRDTAREGEAGSGEARWRGTVRGGGRRRGGVRPRAPSRRRGTAREGEAEAREARRRSELERGAEEAGALGARARAATPSWCERRRGVEPSGRSGEGGFRNISEREDTGLRVDFVEVRGFFCKTSGKRTIWAIRSPDQTAEERP